MYHVEDMGFMKAARKARAKRYGNTGELRTGGRRRAAALFALTTLTISWALASGQQADAQTRLVRPSGPTQGRGGVPHQSSAPILGRGVNPGFGTGGGFGGPGNGPILGNSGGLGGRATSGFGGGLGTGGNVNLPRGGFGGNPDQGRMQPMQQRSFQSLPARPAQSGVGSRQQFPAGRGAKVQGRSGF